MKNTVSKGLFFYILTFLGVIVGVACLFMAILVLSPGTEIFGISYYYEDTFNYVDTYTDNNGENITKKINIVNYARDNENKLIYFQDLVNGKKVEINITTGYSNVYVMQNSNTTHFGLEIKGRVTGISKSDNKKDYLVTSNYDFDNNVYNFKIEEPEILLPFSKTITINVLLPDGINLSNVDLKINTKKGNVRLAHETTNEYNLNSLEINAEESSNISIKNNIIINNGTQIVCPKGTITLKTERDSMTSAIAGGKLFIKTESAKISIDTVCPTEFKLQSTSSSVKIENVLSDMIYDAHKGILIITGEVKGSLTCSEDVVISNIQIEKVTKNVLLPNANSSNITVGYIGGDSRIVTTSGKVKIGDMRGTANIETEKGNVEINFNQPDDIASQVTSRIVTKSGKIKVNYAKIQNQNIIKTTSGEITIGFAANNDFTLIYNCKTNAPTTTRGFSLSGKSGTKDIGEGSPTKIMEVENEKGKTSFSDQYIVA